jgi:Protein of unknown function (DUF2786)
MITEAQHQRSQLVLDKAIDRVRKLLALAEGTSEHEAALAASQATKLIEQFQLTEAMIRLDDVEVEPEPIVQDARLEPELPAHGGRGSGRKRIAWKETIAFAVASDLGIHAYWRNHIDIRGFGRESAIQTWRYTFQYLARAVDQLADGAYRNQYVSESARSWKNAFRAGCAQRLSMRIYMAREARKVDAQRHAEDLADFELVNDQDSMSALDERSEAKRECQALAIIAKDQEQVDEGYKAYSKGFGKRSPGQGSTSSMSGYEHGKRAGDRISLGGKRAALGAGQGPVRRTVEHFQRTAEAMTRAQGIKIWSDRWRFLKAWRRDLLNVTIEVSNRVNVNRLGTCWPLEQRIIIYQGASFIAELGTLLHELAHTAAIQHAHDERWQETFAIAVTEVTSIVVVPVAYNYRVLNEAAKDALECWWLASGNAERWRVAMQFEQLSRS